MAYTYDDFVTAAANAGLLDQFGDDDMRIAQTNPEYGLSALKLTQDLKNATTTEQQLLATEALNQLRKSYGSFGTMSTTDTGAGEGSGTVYQQALKAAETPSFSYDVSQDPTYSALKKSYLREGDRARADTMAQASAMTGGVPSSYAVTAASQAGDYYDTRLADAIPTLAQNAYQKQLAAAELMAGVGDYSLYQTLYGLTDEQLERLQGKGGGYGYTPVDPSDPKPDYSWLQFLFPNGTIDSTSWQALLAQGYTAEELAAAGFALQQDKTPEQDKTPGGDGGKGGSIEPILPTHYAY